MSRRTAVRSGFRRAVASGLSASAALQLFEQVAHVALGVLAPLMPPSPLNFKRREIVILRGAGRHQTVPKLAHEVVHRPLSPGQTEVDRAVPGAEIPDLLWVAVVEHVPVELQPGPPFLDIIPVDRSAAVITPLVRTHSAPSASVILLLKAPFPQRMSPEAPMQGKSQPPGAFFHERPAPSASPDPSEGAERESREPSEAQHIAPLRTAVRSGRDVLRPHPTVPRAPVHGQTEVNSARPPFGRFVAAQLPCHPEARQLPIPRHPTPRDLMLP